MQLIVLTYDFANEASLVTLLTDDPPPQIRDSRLLQGRISKSSPGDSIGADSRSQSGVSCLFSGGDTPRLKRGHSLWCCQSSVGHGHARRSHSFHSFPVASNDRIVWILLTFKTHFSNCQIFSRGLTTKVYPSPTIIFRYSQVQVKFLVRLHHDWKIGPN